MYFMAVTEFIIPKNLSLDGDKLKNIYVVVSRTNKKMDWKLARNWMRYERRQS